MSEKDGKNWVNYKELKARVSMEMVLRRYGLLESLRPSGTNLVGCCPIHKGTNPRQFSVNLEKNAFNCFGNCKSGGNVLDFVAKMEKVSVREAGLLLKNWFLTGEENEGNELISELVREEEKEAPKEKLVVKKETAGVVNPPLTFALKGLDPDHPFFAEKGILPATVGHFGLGYCGKGMMSGRIAIPIHNEKEELVAYCGRAIDERQIEAEGKYKLPPNFAKSEVVYNLHRQARGSERPLIIVESFLSVFRLHQAGFPNAVSLLGSQIGDGQERLLADWLGAAGRAVLCFDADQDGQKCTADCLARLGFRCFVRAVDIGQFGRKPHQLEDDALKQLFGFCRQESV